MSKIMSRQEIETRSASEWVLVEDPELSDDLEVTAGKVAWHSRDRDEVNEKAIQLSPRRAAFLYTGTIPDGTVVLL